MSIAKIILKGSIQSRDTLNRAQPIASGAQRASSAKVLHFMASGVAGGESLQTEPPPAPYMDEATAP